MDCIRKYFANCIKLAKEIHSIWTNSSIRLFVVTIQEIKQLSSITVACYCIENIQTEILPLAKLQTYCSRVLSRKLEQYEKRLVDISF